MTRDELVTIGWSEGLRGVVFLDEGSTVAENAVVLERTGDRWRVYVTQDRAAVAERTVRDFDDESAALDYLLSRLRQLNAALRVLRDV